jgi:hypothetical protein
MTFPLNRMNRILVLGLLFLPIANVSNWVLRKHLAESPADLIGGFLMGVAIATMLLGIIRQRTLGSGSSCSRP